MVNPTSLRELFHELPNCINGINVLPFTFAFYLEKLDYNNVDKEKIINETAAKLKEITEYYNRICATFKTICGIIDKPNLPDDAKVIIIQIKEQANSVGILLKTTNDLYTGLNRGDFKENALKLAKDLRGYENESHSLGTKVQALKDKLIQYNLYYKTT